MIKPIKQVHSTPCVGAPLDATSWESYNAEHVKKTTSLTSNREEVKEENETLTNQ